MPSTSTWTLRMAALALSVSGLMAQEPAAPGSGGQSSSIESLQREVQALRAAMDAQRTEFSAQLAEMQGKLQEQEADKAGLALEVAVSALSASGTLPEGRGRWLMHRGVPGQGALTLSGLMRMRFEQRSNNVDFSSSALDDSGTRMDGRLRLGFEAALAGGGEGETTVTARADLQVAGRFANNTAFDFAGPNTIALPAQFSFFDTPFETVMLYQGYAEFGDLFGAGTSLRLGRQEFVRGSQWLLGNSDFHGGLSHDGLVFQWDCAEHESGFSAFLFTEAQSDGTLNVTSPGEDMNDDLFMGVYTTLAPAQNTSVDLYALRFLGRSGGTDSFVTLGTATAFDGAWMPVLRGSFWTVGGRFAATGLDLLGGKLALSAEAAWQDGRHALDPAGSGGLDSQDIHGFGAELAANLWLDPGAACNPILSLGYFNASGGRANGGTANGWPAARVGFQPLFMNRHFAGGARDDIHAPYFAGGGRYGNLDLIPLDNTQVFKLALSVAASDQVEIGAAWNAAWIADDVGYGTGFFGSELDLFANWDSSESVRFSADFSAFFPSAGATSQSNWLFFAPGGGAGDSTAFGCFIQAQVSF